MARQGNLPPLSDLTRIQKLDYVRGRLREIGFWFVDIPRTSTTTLKLAFYKRFGKVFGKPSASRGIGAGLIPHHVPARLLREQLGADLWDSLYTFSIVRNPFERALSLFLFLQTNGKLGGWTFARYVEQLVQPGGFDYYGHHLGNCGYVCDADGELLVSEVFRFEEREAAMAVIAAKTGCEEILQAGNKAYGTEHRHYSHYYDAASRQRVEDYYRDDLERFAYRFEADPQDIPA